MQLPARRSLGCRGAGGAPVKRIGAVLDQQLGDFHREVLVLRQYEQGGFTDLGSILREASSSALNLDSGERGVSFEQLFQARRGAERNESEYVAAMLRQELQRIRG